MIYTRIRLHAAVALCTLAVVSCGDSPTAPTRQSTIPQGAGA